GRKSRRDTRCWTSVIPSPATPKKRVRRAMVAEDMTLAEVARMLTRIENGMAELREDMAHRFNRTVSAELYSVQHQSIQTDLAEMRSDIDRHYREARNSTAELRDEIGRASCRESVESTGGAV